MELAEQVGIDIIFCPTIDDMYPQGFLTRVKVDNLSEILCGASRPGHFQGVTTIVSKLFNLVAPDIAYFGQKDAQQAIIIKKMVKDLNFDIKIRVLPIKREKDGLAMSSRNRYLSAENRRVAPRLYATLQRVRDRIDGGDRHWNAMEQEAAGDLRHHGFAPQYVAIRNAADLQNPGPADHDLVILAAAVLGEARLIDNVRARAP